MRKWYGFIMGVICTMTLSGCMNSVAVIDDLNTDLNYFVGKDANEAIRVLGLPSNDVKLADNTQILVWQNRLQGTEPRMSPVFVSGWGRRGPSIINVDSFDNVTYFCEIRMRVKDQKVIQYELSGDNAACSDYLLRMRQVPIPIQPQ